MNGYNDPRYSGGYRDARVDSAPVDVKASLPNGGSGPVHGIGCMIAQNEWDECVITKVVQGGAASFSGQVFVNDIVVSIDGKPTKDIHPDLIGRWFLGEPGTAITLELKTPLHGHDPPMPIIIKPLMPKKDPKPNETRQVRLVRQPLLPVGGGSVGDEIAGIGAVLASDVRGNIVVARVVYGGAASFVHPSDFFGENRLMRNDKIVAIDGRDIRGLQPVDLRPLLIGPVGSNVTLKIKRAKYEEPVDITIRRKPDQMQTQFVPFDTIRDPPPPEGPTAIPSSRVSYPQQSRAPPLSQQLPSSPPPLRAASPPPQRPASPPRAKQPPPQAQPLVRASPPPPPPQAAPVARENKVGVGLVLREHGDGSHTVKRLKPKQAAERCGLIEPQDLLTHVDGVDIARGAPGSVLADLIAGKEGTVVNLSFQKPSGKKISVNLMRGGAEYITSWLQQGGDQQLRQPSPERDSSFKQRASPPAPDSQMLLADAVGVSLTLEEDYDQLVTDPQRLQAFNVQFKSDIATALRADQRRVQLIGLQRAAGIIVDLNILPDAVDTRPSQQLAAELAAQVADPRSALRNAPSTNQVLRADVHTGAVVAPPNAPVISSPGAMPTRSSPPQAAPMREPTQFKQEGIGLVLREEDDGTQRVRRLVPGQSAERCGVIRVDDTLTHVDGKSVVGHPVTQTIPGPEGSTVHLKFRRPDSMQTPYEVSLVRGSAPFIAALSPQQQQRAAAPPPPPNAAPTRPPQQQPNPAELLAQKKAGMVGGETAPMVPRSSLSKPSVPAAGGREVRVMLALRGDPSSEIVPVVLPQTWPELLQLAAERLGTGMVTRVYNDSGVPVMGMGDIVPGEKLLVHAVSKGLFESWSMGLVVKQRYVLRERLGEGGLGQLWVASDTMSGAEVVLSDEGDESTLAVRKVILEEEGKGDESIRRRYREERFMQEAQTVQDLQNRYICAVLDCGLQQGRMFLVQERLNGQTLAERLSLTQVMTEAETTRMALHILAALEAAQAVELTHANITPSNIFLTPDNASLLGLGVAGWDPAMINNSNYKLPVKAIPQYMSPEQASGSLVDGRSDLFSVGVVMYRCVTGHLPFDGPVYVEIIEALMTAPLPNIQQHARTPVSDGFAYIVAKALAKSPEQRFSTAQSMREELERL